MTPTEILDRLRVLFGIAEGDNTHDEDLLALFDTALAAARVYTHRWLYPVEKFRETFHQLTGCPRLCGECGPVYVAEVPVTKINSATRDGAALDAASIIATASGALYEKTGAQAFPLAPFTHLELDYEAGYAELPDDLAEALCQIAAAAGGASIKAAGGSVPDAPVKRLTVFDVGSVEYAQAAGSFYAGEVSAPSGGANAIIGPWASVLDAYRDLAKSLGDAECIRTLANLGAAAPAAAAAAA